MKTKLSIAALVAVALALSATTSFAQAKKPNILVIWGDDIGWYNPSIYHRGDMGYSTPNIDRIGKEGAMFTCWDGQQSCTAGRAAFITGQSPIRTGLTKVGLPGADIGLSAKADRMFVLVPAQALVGQWLQTFKEFPQRQKPASFNLDEVMRSMSETQGGGK